MSRAFAPPQNLHAARSSLAAWQAGVPHNWKSKDTNFDDAFRSAKRGESQILSGNGEPV